MKVNAPNKILVTRNESVDKTIENNEQFDTRTDEQKENLKKTTKPVNKTVSLASDSELILTLLKEATGISERGILGSIVEQGLKVMKPKLEAAIKMGMVPKIDITK